MKILNRHFIIFLLVLLTLSACSRQVPESVSENCGSWAYIHDKETEILKLDTNGKAFYLGEKYSYTEGDGYLELKGSDGTVMNMRFVPEYDHMLLYERKVYTYDGEGEPQGITGLWKMGNLSFEFTPQGSYIEDGVFPGHYLLNEDEHSIRLAYNDHFTDAILYYEVNGNELIIDYPMPVVQM